MKITYEPYPESINPKNTWALEVKFMSGDADAFNTVKYEFKSVHKFTKAYESFKYCMDFEEKNHNVFIDIWDRSAEKEEVISELHEEKKRFSIKIDDILSVLDELYTHVNYLKTKLDIPMDVICDDYYAAIYEMVDMYYFDEHGNKLKIVVSE